MTSFRARTQYHDWTGTAAADDADVGRLDGFLRETGLIADGEFLLGVEIYVGENHEGQVKPPNVHALIFNGRNFDNIATELADIDGPIPVRRARVDVSLNHLLGLFKRVSVNIGRRGLDLTDREYIEVE